MINTLFTISGITYEPKFLQMSKSMSEFGVSSNFTATFDNPFGRHSDDFNIADEVRISADKNNSPAGSLLFRGILEKRTFEGVGNTQSITLLGRDYTARLMDVTVEPVVYTNSEVSTIVTNIINNEVPEITTINVNITTTTLDRIAFNHLSVYEALTQLADLSGFIFYIDTDKDLHFEKRNSVNSNITFDNTNILSSYSDTTREGLFNQFWVYGDRQLTHAPTVIFTQTAALGSVVALTYKPHNTQVQSSQFPGSSLIGGILNMGALSGLGGTEYLVSYEDREIIMVSGTRFGIDRIPPDGGSLVINYDRSVPIIKFGQNNASVSQFGPKEKVIVDRNIQDPTIAKEILITELENSLPLDKIELTLNGWHDLIPGQVATINIPNFNLSGKSVGILDVSYNLNPETTMSENIISVSLDNKITDFTDQFVDLNRRLKKLEVGNIDSSDVFSRLEFSAGSLLVVGSKWNVFVRGLGSSFILGVGFHGVEGSTFGGILGSIVTSGINFLGDSRSGLVFVTSGGYSY